MSKAKAGMVIFTPAFIEFTVSMPSRFLNSTNNEASKGTRLVKLE
jgi:hypothetical protein